MVRPINPFHFITLKFDVGALGQLFFSIGAFILAYIKLSLNWTLGQWLVFLGAIIGGTLIQGGMLVLISTIAFFTTRSERVFWVLMFPVRNLINYPLTIFPRAIQMIITFILPFAFVNYLPALILLNKADPIFSDYWGGLSICRYYILLVFLLGLAKGS